MLPERAPSEGPRSTGAVGQSQAVSLQDKSGGVESVARTINMCSLDARSKGQYGCIQEKEGVWILTMTSRRHIFTMCINRRIKRNVALVK